MNELVTSIKVRPRLFTCLKQNEIAPDHFLVQQTWLQHSLVRLLPDTKVMCVVTLVCVHVSRFVTKITGMSSLSNLVSTGISARATCHPRADPDRFGSAGSGEGMVDPLPGDQQSRTGIRLWPT